FSFNFDDVAHQKVYHFINTTTLPVRKPQTDFTTPVKMVNVSVEYDDKKILHNINWSIQSGEKWLLKGHNGAGKSTLLSLIYGDMFGSFTTFSCATQAGFNNFNERATIDFAVKGFGKRSSIASFG